MRVTKAVIPAAGLGTRFLPATKAQPKEMLPLVDKPVIQLVVEEAVRAGVKNLLVVTGRGKEALERHFDRDPWFAFTLMSQGKTELSEALNQIGEGARLHYVRQAKPEGLGDAVLMGEDHVGNEPFAVLLGDDVIAEANPLLQRMLKVNARECASVIAVERVPKRDTSLYGVIEYETTSRRGLYRVRSIVEKPTPAQAPSNLAAIGRYVLEPAIFPALRGISRGYGNEIQLTDALNVLAQDQPVYALLSRRGGRYDIGNKLDYLKATVELAAQRDDLGKDFKDFLRRFVQREKLI